MIKGSSVHSLLHLPSYLSESDSGCASIFFPPPHLTSPPSSLSPVPYFILHAQLGSLYHPCTTPVSLLCVPCRRRIHQNVSAVVISNFPPVTSGSPALTGMGKIPLRLIRPSDLSTGLWLSSFVASMIVEAGIEMRRASAWTPELQEGTAHSQPSIISQERYLGLFLLWGSALVVALLLKTKTKKKKLAYPDDMAFPVFVYFSVSHYCINFSHPVFSWSIQDMVCILFFPFFFLPYYPSLFLLTSTAKSKDFSIFNSQFRPSYL